MADEKTTVVMFTPGEPCAVPQLLLVRVRFIGRDKPRAHIRVWIKTKDGT